MQRNKLTQSLWIAGALFAGILTSVWAAQNQDQSTTTTKETRKKGTHRKGSKGTSTTETTATEKTESGKATSAKETTAKETTAREAGTRAPEAGHAASAGAVTGTITASPNPCRIAPGKVDCTTYLTWSSTGPHARVYVSSQGKTTTPEREFATGRAHQKVSATWIGANTSYKFTLVDFSTGNRGRDLASVVVTASK